MAERLYLDERELQRIGLSEPNIRTIRKLAEFVDTQTRLAEAEEAAEALDATVVALDGSVAAVEAAVLALDARIDAYDALDPFVRQDQTAAWADSTGTGSRATFATFAGQAVSNPPTQAEAQAIDDHLVIISRRLGQLINDLRTVSVLT
jgi:hypothetical protein